MTTRRAHRIIRSMPILAMLAIGALVIPTSTASAAARDARCEYGEVCFFYNSDQSGAISDFDTSVAQYGSSQPGCYDFKGVLNGAGRCLKNNAASVVNLTDKPLTVYFNSNYQGPSQTIPPYSFANLNSTLKNNNASHRIG